MKYLILVVFALLIGSNLYAEEMCENPEATNVNIAPFSYLPNHEFWSVDIVCHNGDVFHESGITEIPGGAVMIAFQQYIWNGRRYGPENIEEPDCGSVDGVQLPCFGATDKYPLYPYAQRPDGCSVPGNTGEFDHVQFAWWDWAYTDACNNHDRCYYTLGTTFWECNNAFFDDMHSACDNIPNTLISYLDPTYYFALAECKVQAEIMWLAVIASDGPYVRSQKKQEIYEANVQAFLNGEANSLVKGALAVINSYLFNN